MKYIKTYEFGVDNRQRSKTLYKNDEFSLEISSNDSFNFNSKFVSAGAIIMMAELVKNDSKYLDDIKLKDVTLREKDIEYEKNMLMNGINLYLGNIKEYRSSNINKFLNCVDSYGRKTKSFDAIPEKVYIDLVLRYHPIIANAIERSKTIGDIIDNFKIIHKDINEDLKNELMIHKYNL